MAAGDNESYVDDTWTQVADDSTWILSSAFMILTMQTGFALLESGFSAPKNVTNVSMKNVVDVIVGGIGFWICGYAFAFGEGNSFMGMTGFLLEPGHTAIAGQEYASFLFHFAFCSTAVTIVSGGIAGRMKFQCYSVFAFFFAIFYGFSAHWVWGPDGFLGTLGFYDFAGCGPVHLFGGTGALVGAYLLGPRIGRFNEDGSRGTILPVYNTLLVSRGFLTIWWGWIGFNCGSTFGSQGIKGTVACRVGAVTVVSACGGGLVTLVKVLYPEQIMKAYFEKTDDDILSTGRRQTVTERAIGLLRIDSTSIRVEDIANSVLSALVAITGGCSCVNVRASFIIGLFSPVVTSYCQGLLERFRIDDPVGAVGVHGAGGIYGLLCIALFADPSLPGAKEYMPNLELGLFLGGPFKSFGVQLAGVVTILAWGLATSFAIFHFTAQIYNGNRVSQQIEMEGLDAHEHDYDLLISKEKILVGATAIANAVEEKYKKQRDADKDIEAQQAEHLELRAIYQEKDEVSANDQSNPMPSSIANDEKDEGKSSRDTVSPIHARKSLGIPSVIGNRKTSILVHDSSSSPNQIADERNDGSKGSHFM